MLPDKLIEGHPYKYIGKDGKEHSVIYNSPILVNDVLHYHFLFRRDSVLKFVNLTAEKVKTNIE